MTIALIILAAGHSRRFGVHNKLLAQFEGEPLIVRTVRRLGQVRSPAGALAVTVVTQSAGDEIAQALKVLKLDTLRIVANPRAMEGMGTSISAGVASLGAKIEAAIITPGDMPFLTADLIERLVAAFLADGGQRPACPVLADGTPKSPVVWPRRLFASLRALSADEGGRTLLRCEPLCPLGIEGDELLDDIDTPADLAALHSRVTDRLI